MAFQTLFILGFNMRLKEFLIVIISTILMVALLMNKSLKLYLEQQHYQSQYPLMQPFEYLVDIPDNIVFDFAHIVRDSFVLTNTRYKKYDTHIQEDNIITVAPQRAYITPIQPQIQSRDNSTKEHETQKRITKPYMQHDKIYIDNGDKVLLIGDSLMQGVGMTLVSQLKKLGAYAINLGKQNTGLTYKSYFDWEKTLEEALNEYQNVKYIVVFLGANDPWDMSDPNSSYGSLKFKTQEWEKKYRQRITQILSLAQEHHAIVFWYEVPYMKNVSLNNKIIYLNQLYKEEVEKRGGVFLKSNSVLSEEDKFTAYITKQDKKIKVRANDGVHFTGSGSRLLTDLFIKQFTFKNKENASL